jgi:hypothetical protein
MMIFVPSDKVAVLRFGGAGFHDTNAIRIAAAAAPAIMPSFFND